jgi:hypothetical protein
VPLNGICFTRPSLIGTHALRARRQLHGACGRERHWRRP